MIVWFCVSAIAATSRSAPRGSASNAVREAWLWGWNAYEKWAWGRDEVRPLSRSFRDETHLGKTLVESLATMWIMELDAEFERAVTWVAAHDWRRCRDVDTSDAFRVLGALLSARALSGDERLLERAVALGEGLVAAVAASPTGIPYPRLADPSRGVCGLADEGGTAGASSVIVPLRELERITGRDLGAGRVLAALAAGDLVVTDRVRVDGGFVGSRQSVGPGGDAYYDALLKSSLQNAAWEHRWLATVDAVHDLLLRPEDEPPRLVDRYADSVRHRMSQLACAWPGLLGVSFHRVNATTAHLDVAKALIGTCVAAHRLTNTGIAPDAVNFGTVFGAMWPAPDAPSTLRPETIESLFVLHRVTRDPIYPAMGWELFESLQRTARLESGGYAALDEAGRKLDVMPTHLLSETLLFLYLLFLDNETSSLDQTVLSLDDWLFAQGGHPLPVRTTAQHHHLNDDATVVARVGRPVTSLEDFAIAAARAGHDVLCPNNKTTVLDASFGTCTIGPCEDGADAASRCVRAAVEKGKGPITRAEAQRLLEMACTQRICCDDVPEALTFSTDPVGTLTIEPWEDPADVVERFARAQALAGRLVTRDDANTMVGWFCAARSCSRLRVWPDIPLDDSACFYWEPPEFAIRRLNLDGKSAALAMRRLCDVKPCGGNLDSDLALDVWDFDNSSVGTLRCGPLREPADCVEHFVRKSLNVFKFAPPVADLNRAMGTMLKWLCGRRQCSRPLSPQVHVTVNDTTLVAQSWEEPWKVAADYAEVRFHEASPVTEDVVRAVYEDICRHRAFCATLPLQVGVSFQGVGNLTCRTWEQPADVVDHFARSAVELGHILNAPDLRHVLNLLCSRRNCGRTKLAATAAALVMHPGKTAGRALATAVASAPNVFVLGHDRRCGRDVFRRECHIVLRDPVDRFVSALAFKKQGGEWGGEQLLGNTCHRWLHDRRIDDVLDDIGGLNANCAFANATSDQSTHCIFRPLRWWVADNEPVITFLCYDRLQADFDLKLRPHCPPNVCHLKRQNPSDHSTILGPAWDDAKLHAFVKLFYADDIALYDAHCRNNAHRHNARNKAALFNTQLSFPPWW